MSLYRPFPGDFIVSLVGSSPSAKEANNGLLSDNYGALPEALVLEHETLSQSTGEVNKRILLAPLRAMIGRLDLPAPGL